MNVIGAQPEPAVPGVGGGGGGGQAGDGCDDCALTVRAQLRSSGVIFLILPVRRSLWFAASPRLCHLVLCFLLFLPASLRLLSPPHSASLYLSSFTSVAFTH